MPPLLRPVVQLVLLGFVLACPVLGRAQTAFAPLGQEYAVAGALPGDQVFPDVSIGESGGFIVWQDAFTDGSGLGISARKLDGSLSGELASFRINEQGQDDQEHPRVARLANGGAVFVWQSGRPGFQNVYARFLSATGTFLTGDVRVSATTNENQVAPAVAGLADGSVVVVWTKYQVGDALQDVFGQRFSSTGQKLGGEFQVSPPIQFDACRGASQQNQRSPSVAALANGNFAVAWATECASSPATIFSSTNPVTANAIIYGRIFNPAGQPLTEDVRVSLREITIAANPAIAALPDGGFTVAWNQRDPAQRDNGWDIYARVIGAAGEAVAPPVRVNTFTYGDQFAPRIAALGADQLVVWSSLGQDGSMEGVYGRFLTGGSPVTNEFLVNWSYTVSKQIQPVAAADGSGRFLVAWSTFKGGANSFDLAAQRYMNAGVVVDPPAAPYVFALSSTALGVSWPELAGFFNLAHYEVFQGNNPQPIIVSNNYVVVDGLTPGTAYSFILAYRFQDGTRSPLSASSKGATWGVDGNGDGLPDTWQMMFWGPNPAVWAAPNADSDGDGANDLMEFLSGTNPLDPASVLRTRLTLTATGGRLGWNTEPGFIYQVQKSVNFSGWENYGSARFAAGTTDSVSVDGLNGAEFYRVIRVR